MKIYKKKRYWHLLPGTNTSVCVFDICWVNLLASDRQDSPNPSDP